MDIYLQIISMKLINLHINGSTVQKLPFLVALDERQAVFLLLLDLSAAFDTVNHSTLLSRLQLRYGITGQALFWLKSYLCNRTQTVSINNVLSSSRTLDFGVPQGSVLGPILFSLYTAPITDIICSHGLNYHLYADDTQLYLAFDPACNEDLATAKLTVENCVADIRIWMSQNHLKLNDDKSELLVFHSRFSPRPDILNLTVGDESITPSTSCRNIGVVFDDILSFGKQVNALCKTSFWHLRNIWRIRTCLDKQSLEIVVHAFITNKLDFCNTTAAVIAKSHTHSLRAPNAQIANQGLQTQNPPRATKAQIAKGTKRNCHH